MTRSYFLMPLRFLYVLFYLFLHHKIYYFRKAAIAIGNTWSIGVDGAVERIIEMMQDEDENVAKLACSGAGNLHDDAVVEPIVNILNDPSKASLHGEAVRGLSYIWLNYLP